MFLAFSSRVWSFIKYHRWKTIFSLVGVVIVGGGAYAAFKPTVPEYITEVSQRGDLVQTVEAVGTVISDRDLELQFRSIGIVSQVLVKEGDIVKAGQRLASTRSGDLSASVAAASARVKEAEAALRTLREGARPEEIAIAEAQLLNRIAALDIARTTLRTAEDNMQSAQLKLDALRQEAAINLSGQVSQSSVISSQNLTIAEQSLSSINDVFSTNSDAQRVATIVKLGIYNSVQSLQVKAESEIITARNIMLPSDYQEAIKLIDLTKKALQSSLDALSKAYDLISSLPTNENEAIYIPSATKEAHRSTLATQRTNAQTALTNLDNWAQSFRNESATYDTRIANEESAFATAKGTQQKADADIRNYETSIQIDEAQLALKKAGNRQSDIDAAQARLRAAGAELARASANLADTVINAPSNGRITKVNIKVGEISPSGPAISMLGESPYRIEIFASEIDIPKVKYEQPATVELDAFPDVRYKLVVGEIDEAQSMIDGVAKYRIKLDFVHPHNEFKLGMTGDTTITTDERKNVVFIPSRAVLEDDQRKYVRVLIDEQTVVEKNVETGMEGEGGDLEIINGIEEGENIILLVK